MKIDMNRARKLMLLCAFSVIAITSSIPVQADGAGAFLGGIAVARIGSNVRDRRDYEEDQAYYAQQQAQATQSQAASQKSPQQRIAELDKLAAGGYITPEEYKAKKQSILDSM
jgi:hypothetical protein